MSLSVSPVQSAKGRKARATALHGPDSAEVRAASRDLAAAKLEQYIERIVAEAPPLTESQRSRLAAILTGDTPELRTLRRPVGIDHDLADAPDHVALTKGTAGGDIQ